jgi:hypothetical protein
MDDEVVSRDPSSMTQIYNITPTAKRLRSRKKERKKERERIKRTDKVRSRRRKFMKDTNKYSRARKEEPVLFLKNEAKYREGHTVNKWSSFYVL